MDCALLTFNTTREGGFPRHQRAALHLKHIQKFLYFQLVNDVIKAQHVANGGH